MIGSLRVGGASLVGQAARNSVAAKLVQGRTITPKAPPPPPASGPLEVTASATAWGPEGPPPTPPKPRTLGKRGARRAPMISARGSTAVQDASSSSSPVEPSFLPSSPSGGDGSFAPSTPERDRASFTAVSGEVPDGAVYLVVAALLGAGGYVLWRKYGKR